MAQAYDFKLPDVGEGLVEAEIVAWRVAPGDTVAVNDVLVEVETAKSVVELPSPWAGTVQELLVAEGQVVPVGTPIIRVAVEQAAPNGAATGGRPAEEAGAGASTGATGAAAEGSTATLVGYGPRAGRVRRRPRRTSPATGGAAGDAAGPLSVPEHAPSVPDQRSASTSAGPARAKPPVRKLAKDLGVDLRAVPGTGPDGTVTRDDVEAYAARAAAAGTQAAPVGVPVEEPGGEDVVGAGVIGGRRAGARETRVPIRGIRRATAQAVTQSAFSAPHATEWVTVDVTGTMDLLASLKERREFADTRLTPLVVAAKAALLALRRTPELNATWDDGTSEIVLKHYVNLGIAVATARGLVVPNIKDADQMTLVELAEALSALTSAAREGRTPPADMVGTSFTITNIGVFGVDGGTPILNPGESGILAIGAIRQRPWVVDGEVVPRWVTTLSLSFDHRIVDGEQASRFLVDVAGILENPANALLLA
jgi:2-oxoisovalerate dehydrogenase E2 component (dihydrolipoyl transacylase)